jgi:hypothetical protein
MDKLEQIGTVLDQVYSLDMEPMTAINQIAQILDEPCNRPEEVSHG